MLLCLVMLVGAAPSADSQTACDRACLTRMADQYFAAIAAHDPSKAPMAKDVRFTEQSEVKAVGEGLWKTASEAPTTFKIADEEKGLVFGLSMFHHPMNEKVLTLVYPDGTRGTRDMTSQRQFDMAAAHIIKVRNRRIDEIEATGAVLPFNSKNGWSEFLR